MFSWNWCDSNGRGTLIGGFCDLEMGFAWTTRESTGGDETLEMTLKSAKILFNWVT